MNSILKMGLVFIMGIIVLILSSYTRTFSAEFVQFPTLIAIFFICGYLLSIFYKKTWPSSIIFLFPSITILVYAFIINKPGFFHYLGESLMIIPSFFIGFFISRWPIKARVFIPLLLSFFYIFYIFKLNPQLYYYNNSIRNKGIKQIAAAPIANFQFINKDSSFLTLDEYKGKIILIDFYFNNCAPCRKKMPDLVKLKNYYKDNKDVILLTIHRGGSESFSDFLALLPTFPKELSYSYDSSSAMSKYLGISSYPLEILIDKSGHIREQLVGYSDDIALVYEKNTIKKIDALLNENN